MDMTRRPDYCGGEEHVLESFIEHGKKYAPLIIKEVDKLGRHIDKVRVGFILDKIIGINNKKNKHGNKRRVNTEVVRKFYLQESILTLL
jgi:predicted transcriptional regulator of viral defense system